MFSEREDRERTQSGLYVRRVPRSGNRFCAPKDRARLSYLLLSLTFFSLLVSDCPLSNPAASIEHQITSAGQKETGLKNVLSTAAQVTLQWDPPASGASQVASYTISYRIHGTTTWTTLATVPASTQPAYTVLHSAVGNGSFDFAVASIYSTGASSPLETSLDPTADPSSGWYLTWGR